MHSILTLHQLQSIQIRNLSLLNDQPILMDSFLQLEIQTNHPILLETTPCFAETNPTFQLEQLLHHSSPHSLHSFHLSSVLKISLHTRPSHPLSSSTTSDHHQFRLVMIWLVDFNELIYSGETELENHFQVARDLNSMTTYTTQSNELYLFFESGVYLFKPSCEQRDGEKSIQGEKQSQEGLETKEETKNFDESSNLADSHPSPSLHSASLPHKSIDRNHLDCIESDHSLTSTTNPKPFVLDDLIRYMKKKIELEQTLEEVSQFERKLRRIMSMSIEPEGEEEEYEGEGHVEEEEQGVGEVLTASRFNLIRKFSQIQQTLKSLESTQTSSEIHLLKLRDRLREQKAEVKRRRLLNESARRLLSSLIRINLTKQRDQLRLQEIPKLEKCQQELRERRSQLMVELSKIYPIEPISGLDSNSSKNSSSHSSLLLFSIADVILPNLEPATATNTRANQTRLMNYSSNKSSSLIHLFNYTNNERKTRDDSADEDSIVSTALGFISHLITLVSSYLNVPLVYPICFFGSRSSVSDFVSRINGPRSFPLYFKGVDRFRFEYGVFLLNKNIEQIMHHQKVVISDLRQTLPNLKNLFLTLEPNPASSETRTVIKESSSQTNNEVERTKNRDTVDGIRRSSSEVRSRTNLRMWPDRKMSTSHEDGVNDKHEENNDDKLKSSELLVFSSASPAQSHPSSLENLVSSSNSSCPLPPPITSITSSTTTKEACSNHDPSHLPLSSQSSILDSDSQFVNQISFHVHQHQHHLHQPEKSI